MGGRLRRQRDGWTAVKIGNNVKGVGERGGGHEASGMGNPMGGDNVYGVLGGIKSPGGSQTP